MYLFTLLLAAIQSYIIISHYLEHQNEYNYFWDKKCGYGFPCIFFYSRFTPKLKFAYALTYFVMAFLGLGIFLIMWIQFDKKAQF